MAIKPVLIMLGGFSTSQSVLHVPNSGTFKTFQGNTIVIPIIYISATPIVMTVSDLAGNVWNHLAGPIPVPGTQANTFLQIFYATNCNQNLNNIVTINLSSSVTGSIIYATDLGGMFPNPVLDVFMTTTHASGGTVRSVGPFSSSNPNDIYLAYYRSNPGGTSINSNGLPSGWTMVANSGNFIAFYNSSDVYNNATLNFTVGGPQASILILLGFSIPFYTPPNQLNVNYAPVANASNVLNENNSIIRSPGLRVATGTTPTSVLTNPGSK